MLRVAYSLGFWLFMLVSSIVLFPFAVLIWLLTYLVDRRLRALHLFTCFWASLYTWLNPAWSVSVKGREKLDSQRATILVANHQSLLDVIVLFRLFTHFKWVSKIENFRIPFIGWNMSLNRYIPLRRGDKSSVVRMMKMSRKALESGNSLIIFPEGTRSPDGRLRRFRPGAFDLAHETAKPIQPIVLRGTSDALPKRGFILKGRHPISIEILDVIPPADFAEIQSDELSEHVRGLIAQKLEAADAAPQTRQT